jgi:hypothetical protein
VKRLIPLVILVACSRGPAVPVDTQLWRLGSPWAIPSSNPSLRVAPGTIISFRKTGEYIEHHCRLIEHADESVYISSRDPHVIAIGTWKKQGADIIATRRVISRMKSQGDQVQCSDVTYQIVGNSVSSADGQYSPVTRLVSPDFEMYINDARKTGEHCPELK